MSALTTRSYADDSAEGRIYFTRYCASCHGPVADGHGPVAKGLHVPPTDLRRLSERYGSPLPPDSIARFIDGRESVPAHGERDMPVWGERFHDINAEGTVRETEMHTRMTKIVVYLNSIQRETLLPRERKPRKVAGVMNRLPAVSSLVGAQTLWRLCGIGTSAV